MRSSKNLARKILCGLLAAGVVGACGNALAAEYTGSVKPGTYNDDVFNLTNKNVSYEMDVDKAGNAITVNSRVINIDCIADTDRQIVGADAWSGDKLTLGSSSTEKITINVNNTFKGLGYKNGQALQTLGLVSNGSNSDVEVNAKEFSLNVIGDRAIAINVGNNTQLATAPANAAKMTINADKIDITSSSTGIAVFSNGQFTLNGDLTVNTENGSAFEVRGNSTANVNTDGKHKTVINGDINFGTPNEQGGDGHNSGNIIDATLNINFAGDGSVWNGKAYQELGNGNTSIEIDTGRPYYGDAKGLNVTFSDGAAWNMTGDSFVNSVTVADGGSINVQEDAKAFNAEKVALNGGNLNVQGENEEENGQKVTINDLTSNNGTINMQGSEQTITVANTLASDNTTINLKGNAQDINLTAMTGSAATVNTNSLDNSVNIGDKASETKIAVNGSSNITDQIASGQASLQDLANVVGNQETGSETSLADIVTSDANDIIGGYSAEVKDGKIAAQSVKTIENTTNRAISDMASISLMTWRQENNDMNKRLGELRDSKGEHGAWARMARGESKYGAQNVKNQYNYYQVGYDEKLSVNPNWTVGVALTRTEGNSTFATGSGENKHTGVAIYGSYLADNGSFLDLIAKYARMDNDYKTIGAGVGDADYETNGYSISAEYGKRFTKDNGFWIEPQVELTYGKVGSSSYTTSKGAIVNQDGIDSLVGRLGFSLGKDIKQGNVYLRASYLYDFDGETTAYMSKAGAGAAKFEQDLGGGWWEVGVGTNINLSDATHLYFDVEKTYGGNVATPWQWNAGLRWSF